MVRCFSQAFVAAVMDFRHGILPMDDEVFGDNEHKATEHLRVENNRDDEHAVLAEIYTVHKAMAFYFLIVVRQPGVLSKFQAFCIFADILIVH